MGRLTACFRAPSRCSTRSLPSLRAAARLRTARKLSESWQHSFHGPEDDLFALAIKRCQISVQIRKVDRVFRHSSLLNDRSLEDVDVCGNSTRWWGLEQCPDAETNGPISTRVSRKDGALTEITGKMQRACNVHSRHDEPRPFPDGWILTVCGKLPFSH